jgi:hypothetical protein
VATAATATNKAITFDIAGEPCYTRTYEQSI